MSQKILVFGLGNIGLGVAKSMHKAGFLVQGIDVSEKCRKAFEELGGKTSLKVEADSAQFDFVVVCLVNERQIREVFLEKPAVLDALQREATVIVTSTVSVKFMKIFAKECERRAVNVLDAPVSGGTARAHEGVLSVFASGTPKAFEKAESVLKIFGKTIYRFGDEVGIGTTYKIIHQLLAGVHIAAAAEAFAFAERVGVDVKKFYDMVLQSAGNSWMFEDRGCRMLEKKYEPKSQVNIFVKDLNLVMKLAEENNYKPTLVSEALKKFIEAQEAGYGQCDDSSVLEMYL